MMVIVDHEPWPTDHVRSEYKKNRKQIATRFAARLKEANLASAQGMTPIVEELVDPPDECDASAPLLQHWLRELRSLIGVARSGVGSPPLPSSVSPPHVLLSDLGLDSLSISTLLSLLRAKLLEACHRTFWGQSPPPFSYVSLMSSSLAEVARACVDVITNGVDDATAAVAGSFNAARTAPSLASTSLPLQIFETSEQTPRCSSSTLAPVALHAQIAQDVGDCVLRAAAAAAAAAESSRPLSPHPAGDVLLTGAAGYLGVHLAFALAESLPSSCRVLCLVRSVAGTDVGAAQRLFAAAAGFKVDLASLGSRIVPLCGDVSQPLLGLHQDVYRSLSLRAIVHAASAVKFIEGSADEGYSLLRGANVLPMQHLLSLAAACAHARGSSFHFHYVSTASVPLPYGQLCRSALQLETFIKESTRGADGYALSKLACETALCEAADSGYLFGACATLCRPGLLTWSTRQGAANNDDWVNRLLATCLQFGCVPDVTEGGSHAKGWAAPVEHCAVDCFATVLARRVIDHATAPLRFLPTPRRSGCEVFTLAAALGALQEALSLRAVAARVWVQAVVHADPALGLRFSPLAVALLGGDGSLKLDSLFVDDSQGMEGVEEAQSWRLGLDKFLRSLSARQGPS
jgi:thioester reductase-like protein